MTGATGDGIGLVDAVALLRFELLRARLAAAAGNTMQFPLASISAELKVAATQSADGKVSFSLPFADIVLGGSTVRQQETKQTVTVARGSPVDQEGNPVRVNASSDELKG